MLTDIGSRYFDAVRSMALKTGVHPNQVIAGDVRAALLQWEVDPDDNPSTAIMLALMGVYINELANLVGTAEAHEALNKSLLAMDIPEQTH